uniref:HCLS1-associated protein X-1 n=1 Tax=Lygus hesperus TaxID=30085 RepID=A0A146KXP0_LYGHE
MDGFDFFRRFLGIPRDGQGFKSPIWEEDEYDEDDELDDFGFGSHNFGNDRNPGFGFRIFTGDPFDMHRDFERQFEDVMRNIMGIMGSGSHGMPALPEVPFRDAPAQPPQEYLKPSDDHPRNRYLKPSFEKSKPPTSRADSDLDGRITGQEIDALFEQPSQQLEPPRSHMPSFFGQSSFTKTVRGPDGRIEHHKTFKSSDGTEQTIITRKFGDQSHSVTVKKNKDGTTEQTEDFVNMDEGDLNKFNQLWGNRPERENSFVPALVPPSASGTNSWVDTFFKIFK